MSARLSVAHDFVQTELVPLAPDSGSYMNEGDVYESNHEGRPWSLSGSAKIERFVYSLVLGTELPTSP
jgi:hypothetical protein